MIEIIDVPVQGFCKGVSKAIDKAQETLHSDCPKPVTVLGSLVHNAYVNDALKKQGLEVLEARGKNRLELLDEIDQGTVIFTAHGVSDAVRQKAQKESPERNRKKKERSAASPKTGNDRSQSG